MLQTKIAQRAFEQLQKPDDKLDKVEVWSSVQSILVAAGNVSKILWPSKKVYEVRGERLRNLLKVEKDNPLSNRKFRNNFFEHYDERVEDWFNKYSKGVYIDLAMNPSLSGGMYSHRGYNSFNSTLEFRGEALDMNALLKALNSILERCKLYVLT